MSKNPFLGVPHPLVNSENMDVECYDAITKEGGYIWPVGSRTICGAATPDSDYDFLVFSHKPIPNVFDGLGFKLDDKDAHYEPSEGKFNSWRRNHINLIATRNQNFARRFIIANETAKHLSLLRRADRVVLFQAILYGVSPSHDRAIEWEMSAAKEQAVM